jgi:prepilin peptidase CpaA
MTALPASAAIWFLPACLPVACWVMWSDLARMRIPNAAVLALVAVFAITGPFALGLEAWAWRWTHLLVVLAIAFVLFSAGAMGGGDAKFAAAMAPFVAREDLLLFLTLFAATLLAAFAAHRAARAVPMVRGAVPHWASWGARDFPMGLALGGSLLFYLLLAIIPPG